MIRLLLCLCLAAPVSAETVVAARTIRAQTLISAQDLAIDPQTIDGGISDPRLVIGMESRVALFAGRPILPSDLGEPAIVERNQIIMLHYNNHGLMISTEGRALGRAGAGELIRVMNLASRSTVTARIGDDGAGYVER